MEERLVAVCLRHMAKSEKHTAMHLHCAAQGEKRHGNELFTICQISRRTTTLASEPHRYLMLTTDGHGGLLISESHILALYRVLVHGKEWLSIVCWHTAKRICHKKKYHAQLGLTGNGVLLVVAVRRRGGPSRVLVRLSTPKATLRQRSLRWEQTDAGNAVRNSGGRWRRARFPASLYLLSSFLLSASSLSLSLWPIQLAANLAAFMPLYDQQGLASTRQLRHLGLTAMRLCIELVSPPSY